MNTTSGVKSNLATYCCDLPKATHNRVVSRCELLCQNPNRQASATNKAFDLTALDYINRFRGPGKQINLDALEHINLFERSGSHTASTRMLSTRCIVLEGPQGFSLNVLDFINRFRGSGKRINLDGGDGRRNVLYLAVSSYTKTKTGKLRRQI